MTTASPGPSFELFIPDSEPPSLRSVETARQRVNRQERAILAVLTRAGPYVQLTAAQIEAQIPDEEGIGYASVAARMSSLVRNRLVVVHARRPCPIRGGARRTKAYSIPRGT